MVLLYLYYYYYYYYYISYDSPAGKKQVEKGNRVASPFNVHQLQAIPLPTREVCMKPLLKYARHAMARNIRIEGTIFDDILSRTRRLVISSCF